MAKVNLKSIISRVVRKVVDYGFENGSGRGFANHAAADGFPLGSWCTLASSPRDDVDKNLPKLRSRSRDLYMSESLIASIVNTRVNGVIGTGLELDAQVDSHFLGLSDDEASDKERLIEMRFKQWSRNAGINGESLDEVLRLVEQSILISGDCLVRVAHDSDYRQLKLEVIEGDLVRTPEDEAFNPYIRCGIEITRKGRTKAFYVADNYDNNTDGFEVKYERLIPFMAGYQDHITNSFYEPSGSAIHCHLSFQRPDQRRGVPLVSPIMGNLKQLSRYKEAELDAAVVSAKAAMVITHPATENDAYADLLADGAIDPHDPQPISLGNGSVIDLEDGAHIESFDPNRPNTAYAAFVQENERQICAACGIPKGVATCTFDSSYNASRAELLAADTTYRIDRSLLIRQLLRPVYCAWLDMHADELGLDGYYTDRDARSAWRACEWIGAQLPTLDPTKEIDAAAKRVALGVSTLARESQIATGTDIVANIRQRGYEEALLKKYKLVKDQNGIPLEESTNDND